MSLVSIGLIFKRRHAGARVAAEQLLELASAAGVRVRVAAPQHEILGGGEPVSEADLVRDIRFLVVIGGDGTLLYAAGLLDGGAPVPVLGVNMGRLGFLTPFSAEGLAAVFRDALDGRLHHEDRMRLAVRVERDGAAHPVGIATNDAVISQGGLARLIELEAWLDEEPITTYRADGLIVSTPTGSTAYNLAAGGPLLTPGLEALCLTPICPHALTNRTLVLPAKGEVSVRVLGGGTAPQLTLDGQVGFALRKGDEVRVDRAATPLRLFRAPDKDIFELMRTKLGWSGGA